MSDFENDGFRGQGRPQVLDLLNLDQGVFPNEAFETSLVDGNESPVLTLKDPWAMTAFLKDNRIPFKNVTDDLTIDKEDYYIYYPVTLTTVDKTITLPSPADYEGRMLEVILVSTTTAKLSFSYSGNFLWKGYSNVNPTLRESGEKIKFFSNGTNWIILKFTFNRAVYVEDQRSSGDPGGNPTIGAWTIRPLSNFVNTPLWGASIAANTVTVVPGIYNIIGYSPLYKSGAHKCKICDSTALTDIKFGSSEYSGAVTNDPQTTSFVRILEHVFTVSSGIQLFYYATLSGGGSALGIPTVTGDIEIFGRLRIKQVIPLL